MDTTRYAFNITTFDAMYCAITNAMYRAITNKITLKQIYNSGRMNGDIISYLLLWTQNEVSCQPHSGTTILSWPRTGSRAVMCRDSCVNFGAI